MVENQNFSKLEAEGQESKCSEQFLKQKTFLACYCRLVLIQIYYIGTIEISNGSNNWDNIEKPTVFKVHVF